MLHARMVRPATLGSTLLSAGTVDRTRFPTAEVVTKGSVVAVVSPNEWEAVAAARAVAAQTTWTAWSGLPGSGALTQVIKTSRKPSASRGDAATTEAALAAAATTVSATYEQPFVKHAPIGAFLAVAHAQPDGFLTVWTHSAQSQGLRAHLAHVFDLPLEKVTVRWLEGAGQYGRTTLGGDGAEADAVILSQLLGAPVRVQWSVQEDLAWSGQSPAWVADGKIAVDAGGRIQAIQTDFYSAPTGDARMVGAVLAGLPDLPVGTGAAPASFFHNGELWSHIEPRLYDIPSALHRSYGMPRLGSDAPSGIGLRGQIFRTPGQRQHIFVLESLINEAAAAAGRDPIEFRIANTRDQRLIDILRKTAGAARWSARPSPGPDARRTGSRPVTGRGVCFLYRSGTYWAAIAEVEVTPSTGVVKVTKVTAGVDPGKIINPLDLQRNLEGGIVMGVSETMVEELAFDREKITSTDWSRYPILTMADSPEIQVVTISRDDEGFGAAGEAPNALAGPAIAAAIFDATGVQPRRTPFRPEYIRELLKA
jgi:CO/xanthine dehydrogenase Mo-binding subunit